MEGWITLYSNFVLKKDLLVVLQVQVVIFQVQDCDVIALAKVQKQIRNVVWCQVQVIQVRTVLEGSSSNVAYFIKPQIEFIFNSKVMDVVFLSIERGCNSQ